MGETLIFLRCLLAVASCVTSSTLDRLLLEVEDDPDAPS
jgi:hypothetical protein